MKTTKFFSVLSLALMLLGMTTGFTKRSESLPSQSQASSGIYYMVMVHPPLSSGVCGNYVIKVLNEAGHPVAPLQTYVPGQDMYMFTEVFNVMQGTQGRRVAVFEEMLIPDCPQCVCPYPLNAVPDVKAGPFLMGQVYIFNLYPKNGAQSTK